MSTLESDFGISCSIDPGLVLSRASLLDSFAGGMTIGAATTVASRASCHLTLLGFVSKALAI